MKDKNFIITMVIIVGIIIALLIYYFSGGSSSGVNLGNFGSNQSEQPNSSSGDNNSGSNTDKDKENDDNQTIALSHLNDYEMFFTLSNIINEYYQDMIDNNQISILNKLDNDYIKVHSINKNNIKNYMERNYENITFYANNIYIKGINNTKYYFIDGEIECYDFAAEMLTEDDDINYLVTINSNKGTYSVTPLLSDISVFEYAQNYKSVNKVIEINEHNTYTKSSMDDEQIALYYLNYFKNKLYLNTEKAYEMLEPSLKKEYPTYEIFNNHLDEIYNKLSTNVFSYSSKGDDGKKFFSVITSNQVKINFKENSIMNFTVTIES